MNKKILLILSLIILILSLNTFSASDNSTNSINVIEKSVDNELTSSNSTFKEETSNDIYVDANSKNKLEDGSKTAPYKNIDTDKLNNISIDSTVHVAKGTYKINSTVINKNVNIIGDNKNKVIFMPLESNSAFIINPNANVKFANFTLRNFTSDKNAAITNNGNLIIENLNLESNIGTTSANMGGSIRNNGNLTVINSLFEKNKASFGAAIYNTKNLIIINSKFKENSIYNVGGAIYSLRGNLYVYDSYFSKNSAVSGAAIYNAAGYMYVNNTEFYRNDAAHFFGGAIYSTGITVTNNSQFYLNHAKLDGGAITTTNNFTIINSLFQENSAEDNGGAIENIPWSQTEQGNLTIVNSSFIENSAGINGGAFINYNRSLTGFTATITARNCLFDSNSAGSVGGLVFNEQYIDFENNIIVGNEARECNVIYSKDNMIKSVDNNWWGTNNPTEEDVGVKLNNWVVMNFTNTTALITNLTSNLKVSLNTLNTGDKLETKLGERVVIFSSEKTVLPNYLKMNDEVNLKIDSLGDELVAQVDNQQLSLNPVDANITYKLINKNTTLQLKFNLPIKGNSKVSIKVNSITIINKATIKDGVATLNYDIPNTWTNRKYPLEVVIQTQDNATLRDKSLTLIIPKRNVTFTFAVLNYTPIKAGSSVKLVSTVKLRNKKVGGTVTFKVNNKTIASKLKLVDGKVVFVYKIPENFSSKTYKFSAVFSGDNNKYSRIKEANVSLEKQNVHSVIEDKISVKKNSTLKLDVKLLDENNNNVTFGRACYKINDRTVKTDIVITNGIFVIDYNIPDNCNSDKLTLTIKYGANSKYNSLKKDIQLIFE